MTQLDKRQVATKPICDGSLFNAETKWKQLPHAPYDAKEM